MKFRPLHRDFGAEVRDFDTQSGGSAEEIAALRAAWAEYGLLLFRGGGRLAPDRQLEIAAWFGPPPPVANSAQAITSRCCITTMPPGRCRSRSIRT